MNGNGHRPAGAPRLRDDTTRYLCAAAHLDPGYADRAIREFLIEPTRPVPASPGLDAAAVLGEAVAARTRRKLRDVALVLLMIEFVIVAPLGFVLGWLVLSLPFAVPGIGAQVRKRAPKVMVWLVVGVIAVGALMFFGRGPHGRRHRARGHGTARLHRGSWSSTCTGWWTARCCGRRSGTTRTPTWRCW